MLTAWAPSIYEERASNQGKDNPSTKCLPTGIPPDMLRNTLPFKIVQTASFTVILLEEFNSWRQIFTDGRP